MIKYEACRVCQSDKLTVVRSFDKDNHRKTISQCNQCGFAFDIEENRRTFYGDDYFDGYVADSAPRKMRKAEARWLAKKFNLSGKTYMEIGPGMGQFLEGLKEKVPNLKCHAVEIAARGAEACGALGATVLQRDWEALSYKELQPYYEACDIVASIHCIEHMEQPLLALRKMVWLLKPGGMLYIHTPNHDNAVDSDWFHYALDHIALFGEPALRVAFDRVNVQVVEVRKLYGDDLIVIGKKRNNDPKDGALWKKNIVSKVLARIKS